MRLLLLALLAAAFLVSAQSRCQVEEFYFLAWTTHNPAERHRVLLSWLERNTFLCRPDDYVVIYNNLAEWAGTADTPLLRYKVIEGHNNSVAREKK